MTPTACAHTFVRVNLYVQEHTIGGSYCKLNKNELAARAFEGVSVLVLVLWSWVLVAERAFKTGGCAGRVLVPPPCQLAKHTGAGVSWLRALWRRRKLAAVRAGCVHSCSSQSHVACQQVVGCCLAIWVYAGLILFFTFSFSPPVLGLNFLRGVGGGGSISK